MIFVCTGKSFPVFNFTLSSFAVNYKQLESAKIAQE